MARPGIEPRSPGPLANTLLIRQMTQSRRKLVKTWSGPDWVIRSYLEVPENFMRFIFKDSTWFMFIQFACIVKFMFLAQFSVDHLPRLLVSVLIFLLCKFTYEKFHKYTNYWRPGKTCCHSNLIICLACFSHQRLLMVFHWRLSDSKFPQVSRTLLSIPADHSNVVVWMVSTRPLVSKLFNLCTIFWWLYRAPQLQLASLLLSCPIVFSVP